MWNFLEEHLPRTAFGEYFVSGDALVEPCQNSKHLVHQTNKHPLLVVTAILGSSYPEKKTWNIPQKMCMMKSGYDKAASQSYCSSIPTFSLNMFNFFRAAIL